jgi:precorrin-6Y C5,15-methyltransferase (decarboxylating) CbiT subunit
MKSTFGLPDDQFIRGDIPMTKREIRIFALAQAAVKSSDIVWDIGAGTGSLSVESALQACDGKVYAIERETEGCSLIRENANKFGCSNVETICGSAPEALKELPEPDLIWVGGSGGNLQEILSIGAERLRAGGRMIILSILAETLQESLHFAAQHPLLSYEACGLQVTRIEPVKKRHMMRGLNPIFIIVCRKGAET